MFKRRKTGSVAYKNKRVPDGFISQFNYELMTKAMDFREAKDKSIHFRRNLLEKQKVNNYVSEIERIRGDLSQTVLPGKTRQHLTDREKELKALSSKAIAGMHKT